MSSARNSSPPLTPLLLRRVVQTARSRIAKRASKPAAAGPRSPTKQRCELAAFDTAGSVVAAHLAGLRCLEAGIGSGGHVKMLGTFTIEMDDPEWPPGTPGYLADRTCTPFTDGLLGGLVATRLRTGRYEWTRSTSSLARAAELAGTGEHPIDDAVASFLCSRLESLERSLRRPQVWPTVEMIAQLLLSEETLSGERLEHLLEVAGLRKSLGLPPRIDRRAGRPTSA